MCNDVKLIVDLIFDSEFRNNSERKIIPTALLDTEQ